MQVANVPVAVDVPGYKIVGPGYCEDAAGNNYAYVGFPVSSNINECAANCGCAGRVKGVKYTARIL